MARRKVHNESNLKKTIAAALAVVIAFTATGSSVAQQSTTQKDRAVQLANGLRVIVVEEPAFPIISSQLWVHAGSLNDPSGASGTCHVVEHLLAETMKANGGSLARQLVGSGGRFDAFTSDDFTVFLENLPSSQLELAISLHAERLKDKIFTKPQFDEAAHQVAQELESGQRNPDRTLLREVRALRYTRHPYKNLPAGVEEEIKTLTPQMVSDFFEQYFAPSNATLVIAGDVKQAQVLKLAEKYLGTIPARKASAAGLLPFEPLQNADRRVYLKYGGKKNKLLIAFQAPAATDGNSAAAAVLESLLGSASGGLLKDAVVDTKICDVASSAYELRKRPGMLTINLESAANVPSAKMLQSVEELCDKIKDGGFDDASLAEAKKRAVFNLQKNKIGPYKVAFQLGFFDSIDKLDQAELWQRQIEAVTKQDVMRTAASYLVPAKRSVGFLLAQSSAPSSQKTAQQKPAGSRRSQGLQLVADKSRFGHLVMAGYDPYLDGSKTDSTDEPQDEAPDTDTGKDDTSAEKKPTESGSPSSAAPVAKPVQSDSVSKPVAPESSSKPVQTETAPAATEKQEAPQEQSPRVPSTGLRSNMTEFILPNGIRLIVFKAESSPVVRICGAVRAGHVYDPPAKPGLSDCTVALMNGGSAKISKENSAKMQAQIGLDRSDQIRFFEGREQISFHTNCLATDMATQLKLISHHLTDPLLDDTALSAARNTVAGTIKKRQNTTQDTANRLLLQNLLSDKSQFNPPSPHELLASVLKITADDINQFRANNVAPSTTTIVISGNVDPQQAQRLVASSFKDWQGKAKAPAVNAQPNKRQVTKVNLPNDEPVKVELALGRLLSTPVSRPEYARLLLTDCALMKHPLYARLTNSKKMPDLDDSVSLQSTIMPMAAQCAWILNVKLPEPKLRGITNGIKQQFREIGTTGLTQQELNEMKRFIGGQVSVNRLADVVHSGDSIIDAVSTDREPDYWFNLPSAIEDTALADVNHFIKDEFQPDRSCVVTAGSKKAIKQIPSFRRGKD